MARGVHQEQLDHEATMSMLARGVFALLALLALGTAQAQFAPPPPQRNLFFVLYGGFSYGGDTLAEARITSYPPYGGVYVSNESVKAGNLLQFGAGALWQPIGVPLAVQATIGYQFDSISADNGDITWTRVPIEVLAFYTGVPRWRFGGGARFVHSAELNFDLGRSDDFRFKDTNGLVIETGFQVAPSFWLNLRYVDEEYEVESVNGLPVLPAGKSSGEAFGLNLVWMF